MVPLLTVSDPHPNRRSQSHTCTNINHFDGLVILILLKEVFLVRFLTNFHKDPITHTYTPLQTRSQTCASASLWRSSRIWRCWGSSCWGFQHTSTQTHWVIHPHASPHTHSHTHTSASLCWPRRIDNVESVLFGECSDSGDDGGTGASGWGCQVWGGATAATLRLRRQTRWQGIPLALPLFLVCKWTHTKNSCNATRKTKILGQKTWWQGIPFVLLLLLVCKWPCTQISCTVVMLPERQNAKNATIVVFSSFTEKHSSLHRHRNMCHLHTFELWQSCCHFSHEDSSGSEDD